MGLGPPTNRPRPPNPDAWAPVPGKPHLERNALGQLRTNIPTPPPPLVDLPLPFFTPVKP